MRTIPLLQDADNAGRLCPNCFSSMSLAKVAEGGREDWLCTGGHRYTITPADYLEAMRRRRAIQHGGSVTVRYKGGHIDRMRMVFPKPRFRGVVPVSVTITRR